MARTPDRTGPPGKRGLVFRGPSSQSWLTCGDEVLETDAVWARSAVCGLPANSGTALPMLGAKSGFGFWRWRPFVPVGDEVWAGAAAGAGRGVGARRWPSASLQVDGPFVFAGDFGSQDRGGLAQAHRACFSAGHVTGVLFLLLASCFARSSSAMRCGDIQEPSENTRRVLRTRR